MKILPVVSLTAAVLLTAACACPSGKQSEAACAAPLETSAKASTVQTLSGPVAGYIDGGVYIYKGIPYAKAARFMPAEDPDPWTEVRASRAYGPTCPQDKRMGWYDDNQAFAMHWDDGFPDEDCLRVNVWTAGIKDGGKRPVMVWLHGGGFRAGSGQEQIGYDGTNLARDHGVVVVSLNHRLNALGFLDLSAYGAKYAHSGNLGMMDLVKALQWVRDNIAQFGGDPANVTIFGQSGGGGKVSTLMAMPSAKGLFNKAIVQSGSITQLMDPKYSRRIGAKTVEALHLNPSRISEIETVPYEQLLAAYNAAIAAVREEAQQAGEFPENILNAILFGQVPVVDGEIIPAQPASNDALALSKDIPVIIGTTYHEFTRDREDLIFLPLAQQQAADRSAAGCAPVYLYQFTWESPVLDGALGSTHCMEIPFVFDNVVLHRTLTGGGAEAAELGHRISRAWTNFAKTGVPSADGLPEWEPYPARMILNTESSIK
ncbi:MAG: carboxylesterase/lipase family protein [Bacteroidales bacterium]|nr:carboxylesterase/lipase family protein [Bacteroidales bacterium]MBR6423380.1 carboxylesterase/lipase family protein [Bacteroidales bacterium]